MNEFGTHWPPSNVFPIIDGGTDFISGDTFGVDRTGGIPPFGGDNGYITKEYEI